MNSKNLIGLPVQYVTKAGQPYPGQIADVTEIGVVIFYLQNSAIYGIHLQVAADVPHKSEKEEGGAYWIVPTAATV